MAGYSNTALLKKLGYQPGDSVYCLHGPGHVIDEFKKSGIEQRQRLPATWVHGFFAWQKELESFLQGLTLEQIEKGLWLSWPKKASHKPTDLTEQSFRDAILPLGWVDTKVCAIDDTWSGLKFLRRKN